MLGKIIEFMGMRNGFMMALERLLAFFGGVCGLIAIAIIVFKGGAAIQLLNTTASDVAKLKEGGSLLAVMHMQKDDERDAAVAARVAVLENYYKDAMKQAVDIKSDIARMNQKLDDWMAFQGMPGGKKP